LDKIDSEKIEDGKINFSNTEQEKMDPNKIESVKHENSSGKNLLKNQR
jgi:hypothetical protein